MVAARVEDGLGDFHLILRPFGDTREDSRSIREMAGVQGLIVKLCDLLTRHQFGNVPAQRLDDYRLINQGPPNGLAPQPPPAKPAVGCRRQLCRVGAALGS